MTDKKTETSQGDRASSQTSVLTTPAHKKGAAASASAARSDAGKGGRSVLAPVALVLALVAAGLSGALWLRQGQVQDAQAQISTRLASGESTASQADKQIQEALNQLRDQQARIDTLRGQVDESAAIIRDLDEALRTMTDRGSELVLLNDIDHLATIAQQQLELGGNVRNAIVALESAQAQLARANRPALASLLQTVNGDLDRLRAASTIDVGAFSRQLEELAVLLSEAPLIMPDEAARRTGQAEDTTSREHPAPTVPPAAEPEGAWWEEAWDTTRRWSSDAWGSLREDLGQFIDVRRVDDHSALLMSPDQAARFRENLRTRIMTAQLALMMRQPQVWQAETVAVVRAIETRYDEASPLTRKALRLARSMADVSIDAQLPTVDNTLRALDTLREAQTRLFHGTDPASANGQAGTGAETAEVIRAEPAAADVNGAEANGAEANDAETSAEEAGSQSDMGAASGNAPANNATAGQNTPGDGAAQPPSSEPGTGAASSSDEAPVSQPSAATRAEG